MTVGKQLEITFGGKLQDVLSNGPKKIRPDNLYNTKFETSFGWIALERSDRGVTRCSLPEKQESKCMEEIKGWNSKHLKTTDLFSKEIEKLRGYLEGRSYSLQDIILDVSTAPRFYKTAWAICRSIGVGSTKPYKWVAEKSGSPKASRAVGQAMANNKITLIIPCHRVIGANGNLTGFGKGKTRLDLKLELLELEKAYISKH